MKQMHFFCTSCGKHSRWAILVFNDSFSSNVVRKSVLLFLMLTISCDADDTFYTRYIFKYRCLCWLHLFCHAALSLLADRFLLLRMWTIRPCSLARKMNRTIIILSVLTCLRRPRERQSAGFSVIGTCCHSCDFVRRYISATRFATNTCNVFGYTHNQLMIIAELLQQVILLIAFEAIELPWRPGARKWDLHKALDEGLFVA